MCKSIDLPNNLFKITFILLCLIRFGLVWFANQELNFILSCFFSFRFLSFILFYFINYIRLVNFNWYFQDRFSWYGKMLKISQIFESIKFSFEKVYNFLKWLLFFDDSQVWMYVVFFFFLIFVYVYCPCHSVKSKLNVASVTSSIFTDESLHVEWFCVSFLHHTNWIRTSW